MDTRIARSEKPLKEKSGNVLPDTLQAALDQHFPLTPQQQDFYRENGYIKLRQVLSPAILEHYRPIIQARVAAASVDAPPMDRRTAYGKAFLQVMNLWRESAEVRDLVFGKRIARIAAELMGVRGVRLYHDQALYKEAGGGITPWHADQYYWPVDSDKTITAWIPLQDTPPEMGPLAFCEKSHRLQTGRNLEIGEQSEITLKQALQSLTTEEGGFALGDVSFHAGWTFHRAGANSSARPREVMTMIYMDEDIRLIEPGNKNHGMDMERWMPGLGPGDGLTSPLNPVLYSERTPA